MEKATDDFKSEELNFPKVLSFHLNRILASKDDFEHKFNIEKFEDVLSEFFDNEGKNRAKEIEDSRVLMILDHNKEIKLGRIPNPSKREIDHTIVRMKIRNIMAVINRKGWLMGKVDRSEVWELEEDDAKTD